jgi:CRP/FNR family transcriptional regulator
VTPVIVGGASPAPRLGDVFGFTGAPHHQQSLEAISPAMLIRYTRLDLDRALERNPQAARRLVNLLCDQLSADDQHLLLLTRKDALERLSTFLLALAATARGVHGAVGVIIELEITRTDIADYLGLTIETVSRAFTHLRERHIIEPLKDRRVALLRPHALFAISRSRLT